MKNTMHTEAQRLRRVCVVIILDILCICLSYFLALWIRYDFSIAAIPAMVCATFTVILGDIS